MGSVFLARNLRTGASVAIKVLDQGVDGELLQRFHREGEAQARVDWHPNVVRVHGSGMALGRSYLVMDAALGGDLASRLEAGPLSPRRAAEVVRALARGLEYVHTQGVLHRDLKPHNVLFDEQDTPKLTDFGIAHVAEASALTRTGQVLGTPAYIAPEQALGDRCDVRSDVYGLGAILYAALTGRAPFDGSSVYMILDRVTKEEPVPPRSLVKSVPASLEAICLRALKKQPENRFGSAAELGNALDGFLEGRARKPRRLGQWLIGAVCVAGLVGLGAGVLVPRIWTAPASPIGPSAHTEPTEPGAHVGVPKAKLTLHELRALPQGRDRLLAADARLAEDPGAKDADDFREICREGPLLRLEQDVSGACFVGPSAHEFLSWSRNGVAVLWDAESGAELDRWPAHLGWDSGAASPSGRWIALGSIQGAVWVIDAETHERVVDCRVSDWVTALAFSPDENTLAVGTTGPIFRVAVPSGEVNAVDQSSGVGVRGLAFLQDGEGLAVARGEFDDPNASRLDLLRPLSGELLWTFGGLNNKPSELALSLDGSRIAVGDSSGLLPILSVTNESEGPVRALQHLIGEPRSHSAFSTAHDGGVSSLAFHPSGLLYSASNGDQTNDLRLWDVTTGAQVGRFLIQKSSFAQIDCSGDGRRVLISFGDRIEQWLCAGFQELAAGGPLFTPADPVNPDTLTLQARGVWARARVCLAQAEGRGERKPAARQRESAGVFAYLLERVLAPGSTRWKEANREVSDLQQAGRLPAVLRESFTSDESEGPARLLLRGRLQKASYRIFESFLVIEEALKADPLNPIAYTQCGDRLRRLGDPGAALPLYRRAQYLLSLPEGAASMQTLNGKSASAREELDLIRALDWDPRSGK
jgi:hypothetical protein